MHLDTYLWILINILAHSIYKALIMMDLITEQQHAAPILSL